VGGIREKLIAARRARITEVILPFANKGDFEALPDYLREGITVHCVRSFREVFDIVFDASAAREQLH
jgi:ATP-dependent Lon protease